MEPFLTEQRKIFRFDGTNLKEDVDNIVTEYALTIVVNEEEFTTMVCSPDDVEELVIGFLAAEGIIRGIEQINDLIVDQTKGFAYITTSNDLRFNQQLFHKRYITSCCGKSRHSFYFYNDANTAKKVTSTQQISIDHAIDLMQQMQGLSIEFKNTGGVHNAALCGQNEVIITRTDIGRHNALDKIYGYCLLNHLNLEDKVLAFSGRISSEILLKVSKMGIGIILSKSAPTALALDMADELGITTLGFIRGKTLNIYTHPERIKECGEFL